MTRQYVQLFYKNWRKEKPPQIFAHELFQDMLDNKELMTIEEQYDIMDSI